MKFIIMHFSIYDENMITDSKTMSDNNNYKINEYKLLHFNYNITTPIIWHVTLL
jgi:hypothetical protein